MIARLKMFLCTYLFVKIIEGGGVFGKKELPNIKKRIWGTKIGIF